MLRRSSRTVKAPDRYSPSNYILLTDCGEPKKYKEILQDGNSSKWELAMKNEMDPLIGNCSWGLTKLPETKKALHSKWVYRVKNKQDGSKRYTARLVGKDMSTKDDTHHELGLCATSVGLLA